MFIARVQVRAGIRAGARSLAARALAAATRAAGSAWTRQATSPAVGGVADEIDAGISTADVLPCGTAADASHTRSLSSACRSAHAAIVMRALQVDAGRSASIARTAAHASGTGGVSWASISAGTAVCVVVQEVDAPTCAGGSALVALAEPTHAARALLAERSTSAAVIIVRREVHTAAAAFNGGASANAAVVDADLVACALRIRAGHAVVHEPITVIVDAVSALLRVRVRLTRAELDVPTCADTPPVRSARAFPVTQAASRAHLSFIGKGEA